MIHDLLEGREAQGGSLGILFGVSPQQRCSRSLSPVAPDLLNQHLCG